MRYIVKEYLNCERCPLHQFRRKVVFGRGSIPAEILFIGEAPGRSEDLVGEPFVGPSGKLLDEALNLAQEMAGLDKQPRYFITNVCACRPTDRVGGPNREPSFEEAYACFPRVQATYADIEPRKVVFLGKVPAELLGKAFPEAIKLPHPAWILRQGGKASPLFRALARDLSQILKEVSQ